MGTCLSFFPEFSFFYLKVKEIRKTQERNESTYWYVSTPMSKEKVTHNWDRFLCPWCFDPKCVSNFPSLLGVGGLCLRAPTKELHSPTLMYTGHFSFSLPSLFVSSGLRVWAGSFCGATAHHEQLSPTNWHKIFLLVKNQSLNLWMKSCS